MKRALSIALCALLMTACLTGAGMGLANMSRNADRFHIESKVGVGTHIEMRFILGEHIS